MLKFFKPLPEMVGCPCKKCGKPVGADDVLVQENIPGGAQALLHTNCLEELRLEVELENSAVSA